MSIGVQEQYYEVDDMPSIDFKKLRAVVANNETVSAILSVLAQRQRKKRVVVLKNLRKETEDAGAPISIEALRSAFLILEKSGAGKLRRRSNNNGEIFEFNDSLPRVLEAVDVIPEVPATPAPRAVAMNTSSTHMAVTILHDPHIPSETKLSLLKQLFPNK